MSQDIFRQLSWLPEPSADFNGLCKVAGDLTEGAGREFRALATASLGQTQLSRLARTIERVKERNVDLRPLVPFRLGILSNSTVDILVPALCGSGPRHGVSLEVVKGGYDQVLQDALSPDSTIYRPSPDAVLLAIDYRGLPIRSAIGDKAKARDAVEASLAYLETVREAVKRHSKSICILQTLCPPPETLFGSMDAVYAGSLRRIVEAINAGIADMAEVSTDVILDVAHLASTVGLSSWYSPMEWNLAKVPFADEFVPLYAEHVCRLIAAIRGKSRKCLILDLDNTIWGGVIGDDGIEHIKIGQGDSTGEAYLSVQRLALELRGRGIVLAVCSKNEDDIARSPFRAHPDMLLREDHIAVFQANWKDKPSNIRAIAEDLSLGLDAMVFLDDNPAERMLVRRELPEVAVPELPDDPALYARTLAAAGYFETVAFSEEDARRADFYQDNARRATLRHQTGDLEAYLASLEMQITFQSFDETGRARIAQLINKSNQFNLTTRRYSEAEVAAIQDDPRYFTLQVRLSDVFGDNGMISVVICKRVSCGTWEIDTWLMSCRVLGRRVENMVLRAIVEQARREGALKLTGYYIPTDRNKIVERHYPNLGFRLVKSENDIETYELDVSSAAIEGAPMIVRHIEPAQPGADGSRRTKDVRGDVEGQMEEIKLTVQVRNSGSDDTLQAQLVQIWKDLLDREDIGTTDDFFELGGDSLLGVQLMIEIEKKFHRRFDISALVAHPTIESLANELAPLATPSCQVRRSNKVEGELVEIWKDLLDREDIGTADDFFEIGGDSLLGVRLMIEIEKKFHRRFDISTLVAHPTIESLASELAPSETDAVAAHIVPMRPRGDRTPLFFVHCGTGHVLRYRGLASHLDRDIPLYGIRAPELKTENLPTIEDLARLYIEDIRKIRPHGPYQLFGFCNGGIVAYEIARRLTEMGEIVSPVVMVESVNPAYYKKAPLARALKFRANYVYGRVVKYGRRVLRGEWDEISSGFRELVAWHTRRRELRSPESRLESKETLSSQDIYDDIAILSTICEAYVPKPYAGRVHLIRAQTQKAEKARDMTFGWHEVVGGGLEVFTLPGDHFSLLEQPDVANVADALSDWLVKGEVSVS